ncbi:uncharacterized protein LOC118190430, partial [Stegodyphus dumicola]|uniref:uncharacterized protein LOC118190430 n=1 Tax=Stegodyphus dumicola TaxID=202533 RepID=UPI0015AAC760
MEDILNSGKLELLYDDSDVPLYLHYNGSETNPDLTLAFADISDAAGKEGAGAGVLCDVFSFYLHGGSHTTDFDGEVEAICLALQQLSGRLSPLDKAVILSDLSSALQALASNLTKQRARVQSCKALLSRIQTKVVFQWVPSHCGLQGNEMANLL